MCWLPHSPMHCLPTRNKERLVDQRLALTRGWPEDCARRMGKRCDARRTVAGLLLANNESRFLMGTQDNRTSRPPSCVLVVMHGVPKHHIAFIPPLALSLSLIHFRTQGLHAVRARSHFRTRTTDYWSIRKLCVRPTARPRVSIIASYQH